MDEYGSREIKRSDSAEEENAKKPLVIFGREFSRKQVCAAGAGILCAALLIGGGGYAITHADWTGDSNAPAVSQSKDDEKQDMVLSLEVKADGWDATPPRPSSPISRMRTGKWTSTPLSPRTSR